MSTVTVSQAAALTAKSRETINKATRDGTLSYTLNAQNHKVIEVAELQRVYPLVRSIDEVSKQSVLVTSSQKASDPEIAAELAKLREKLDSSERLLEAATVERDRERRQLESEIESLRLSVAQSQELHSKALMLVTDRSKVTRANEELLEQSNRDLDRRLAESREDFERRIESLTAEVRKGVVAEIKSKPWWSVLRQLS